MKGKSYPYLQEAFDALHTARNFRDISKLATLSEVKEALRRTWDLRRYRNFFYEKHKEAIRAYCRRLRALHRL